MVLFKGFGEWKWEISCFENLESLSYQLVRYLNEVAIRPLKPWDSLALDGVRYDGLRSPDNRSGPFEGIYYFREVIPVYRSRLPSKSTEFLGQGERVHLRFHSPGGLVLIVVDYGG